MKTLKRIASALEALNASLAVIEEYRRREVAMLESNFLNPQHPVAQKQPSSPDIAHQVGAIPIRRPVNCWSKEEIELLAQMYAKGILMKDIAKKISKTFGTSRTAESCSAMLSHVRNKK